MTIDDVAHRGPDRQPCSQSHHFARAQGALVTLLHCVHDTLCTQRDAPPKHKHDISPLPLLLSGTVPSSPANYCIYSMFSPAHQLLSMECIQNTLLLLLENVKMISLQSECFSWCHVWSSVFCWRDGHHAAQNLKSISQPEFKTHQVFSNIFTLDIRSQTDQILSHWRIDVCNCLDNSTQ